MPIFLHKPTWAFLSLHYETVFIWSPSRLRMSSDLKTYHLDSMKVRESVHMLVGGGGHSPFRWILFLLALIPILDLRGALRLLTHLICGLSGAHVFCGADFKCHSCHLLVGLLFHCKKILAAENALKNTHKKRNKPHLVGVCVFGRHN